MEFSPGNPLSGFLPYTLFPDFSYLSLLFPLFSPLFLLLTSVDFPDLFPLFFTVELTLGIHGMMDDNEMAGTYTLFPIAFSPFIQPKDFFRQQLGQIGCRGRAEKQMRHRRILSGE